MIVIDQTSNNHLFQVQKHAQDFLKEIIGDVMEDYPQTQTKLKGLTVVVGEYNWQLQGNTLYVRAWDVVNTSYYQLYNQICEVV
jgi:hypothetical protein